MIQIETPTKHMLTLMHASKKKSYLQQTVTLAAHGEIFMVSSVEC